MILESIQLLTAAWYAYGQPGWESIVSEKVASHEVTKMHGPLTKTAAYKLTHANHPCSVWVKRSASNYAWLVNMTKELCAEKRRRWPKSLPHKCEAYLDALESPPILLQDVGLTPFAVAINSETIRAQYPQCTSNVDECVQAYREYYRKDKPFAAWKNNTKPDWFSVA